MCRNEACVSTGRDESAGGRTAKVLITSTLLLIVNEWIMSWPALGTSAKSLWYVPGISETLVMI